jgi:flagellar motor switch/type III secretory pathway protein FliN
MNSFLSRASSLAVDIGSGWISRYDAGVLKPGDVIEAEEEAGYPQRLRLNGEYFCEVSLAVAGDRFFARIERFDPEAAPVPSPERGDEATELLPFAIRLASIEVELGALSGLGRLSYIDLDKPLSAGDDAELVVAGIPLAAGKVVVVGERFGIRVARRLVDAFEEPEMRTTGVVLNECRCAERIKDYDFRRPDCFTMRGIQKAQAIHLEFLRTLADRLPATAELSLELVDQLAYWEWAEAQGSLDRAYALLETRPVRARPDDLPAERMTLPAKLLLRPASARLPLDPALVSSLGAYAEQGSAPAGARPVIAALDGPMRELLKDDGDLAVTAACLRNGWKRVADLRLAPPPGFRGEVPGDEAAYRGEMVLLARIGDPKGGTLELVYPLRCLEACFRALNA